MRGKWAKGIEPRNFAWVIKDRIAVCERPGGHTANHRKVRRHEEIIWVREHGFARIVSLIPSPHNLHAYEELWMPYEHVPLGVHEDPKLVLGALLPKMKEWQARGEKVLVHQDEISDRLQGVMGAYLLSAGLLKSGPQAIAVIEHVMQRQLGPVGRELVAVVERGL
jgi:hypothetical protein